MKKPTPQEEAIFTITFLGAGLLLGIVVLLINAQFPIVLNMASLLSPHGAQASVGGMHMKHWITGLLLIIASTAIFMSGKTQYTRHYLIILGFGILMVIDELDDITSFIKTGEL